jgi:hypothetical protein
MSAEQTLLRKLLALRESWCELRPAADRKPALEVLLRRPSETELPEYQTYGGKTMHQLLTTAVCKQAVDWRGFTEADLLGAALGSSDEVPFSTPVWEVVVRDRMRWIDTCAAHLMGQITHHLDQRDAAEKN